MITEDNLKEAIAECQGVRSPNANTCVKLASYYTILDHMQNQTPTPSYSYSPGDVVLYSSDSEFSQAINGRDTHEVWQVIDELMSTLQVLHPKLYNSVMRRLK